MSRRNNDQEQSGSRRRRGRPAGSGELRRTVDSYGDRSVRVVYVAAEGARTEPDYFRLINDTYGNLPDQEKFLLKICRPSHSNGLRPEAVVDLVLAEAESKGDLDCEKWAFFDRDAKDNRDAAIPQAMRKASQNAVQVGLSHPSFELWLLLHFQAFTSQEDGVDGAVMERLRNHPKAEGFKDYDKASGDRGKGLDGARWKSLMGKERDAIRNARKLVSSCPHGACSPKRADEYMAAAKVSGGASQSTRTRETESYETWRTGTGHAAGCDPLKRDPSSDVWRLIADLGIGAEDA